MAEMDVTTAVAVLNAAMPGGMFPQGAIPESDADKITEANKIMALADQAKAVVDQVGASNVPLWPIVQRVFEAAGRPVALDASVPAPAPTPVVVPAAPAQPEPTPAPPAMTPPSPPVQTTEVHEEIWLDAGGGRWSVTGDLNAPQLQARSVATGETTMLPSGFLKQRDPDQSTPSPQPPAAPAAPPAVAPAAEPIHPLPTEVVAAQGAPVAVPEIEPLPEQAPLQPTAPVPLPPADRSADQQIAVPLDDDEGDEKYGDLLEQVTSDYSPGFMPAPMDLETPPTAMPEDLTAIGDPEARRLHSQFNALASRARYLLGLESAKTRACDRIYKYNLKGAMREARAVLGKDASVTEVQQLAEDSDLVEPWMRRRDRHSDRADAYKTFLTMYSEDVTVLSRDWTMRDREEKQA